MSPQAFKISTGGGGEGGEGEGRGAMSLRFSNLSQSVWCMYLHAKVYVAQEITTRDPDLNIEQRGKRNRNSCHDHIPGCILQVVTKRAMWATNTVPTREHNHIAK